VTLDVAGGVNVSGAGGNINVAGSVMTGNAARLDASGNLINIGDITASGASTFTSGAGATLALQGGNSSSAVGGQVTLTGGTGGTNLTGGEVALYGGPGGFNGSGGQVTLTAGTGGESGGTGASLKILGGGPNYGAGGGMVLSTGAESPFNYWAPGYNGAIVMQIAGTEYMRVDGDRYGYQGNVGIGTPSPNSKLQVTGGDVYIQSAANGLILRSPGGSCYRVTVANGGGLVSSPMACP
jgi:hypothetical protein